MNEIEVMGAAIAAARSVAKAHNYLLPDRFMLALFDAMAEAAPKPPAWKLVLEQRIVKAAPMWAEVRNLLDRAMPDDGVAPEIELSGDGSRLKWTNGLSVTAMPDGPWSAWTPTEWVWRYDAPLPELDALIRAVAMKETPDAG